MADQGHQQTKRILVTRPNGDARELLDSIEQVRTEEATGNTFGDQTTVVHETEDGRMVHGVPAQPLLACSRCRRTFSEKATVACTDCQRVYCRRHLPVQHPICRYCRFRRW